jgi:hypothetical protein
VGVCPEGQRRDPASRSRDTPTVRTNPMSSLGDDNGVATAYDRRTENTHPHGPQDR